MAETKKYQFVGMVDPSDRTERVQYAKGKFLELKGDPQSLSEHQHEKVSRFAELRLVDEDNEAIAEFGPSPDDDKDDSGGSSKPAAKQASGQGKG